MPKVHDRGGWLTNEPIDKSDHQLSDWERRIDAMVQVLTRRNVMKVDELRRAIEELPVERYEAMAYYERWANALERLMREKGLVTREELDRKVAELEGEGNLS